MPEISNIFGLSCLLSNVHAFFHFRKNKVRELVGPEGQVIGAVSGGVDSSVAAVLLQKAIGDRFHAVLVDNGLLRKNEAVDVVLRLKVCSCFVLYELYALYVLYALCFVCAVRGACLV